MLPIQQAPLSSSWRIQRNGKTDSVWHHRRRAVAKRGSKRQWTALVSPAPVLSSCLTPKAFSSHRCHEAVHAYACGIYEMKLCVCTCVHIFLSMHRYMFTYLYICACVYICIYMVIYICFSLSVLFYFNINFLVNNYKDILFSHRFYSNLFVFVDNVVICTPASNNIPDFIAVSTKAVANKDYSCLLCLHVSTSRCLT